MSIVLSYQRVVLLPVANSHVQLAPNIRAQSHEGIGQGAGAALTTLGSDLRCNAVIVSHPGWQHPVEDMERLDRLSAGQRCKVRIHNPTFAKIQDTLSSTFERQAAHRKGHVTSSSAVSVSSADILPIAQSMYSGIVSSQEEAKCKIQSATMIYMSDYGPSTVEAAHFNAHIDFNHGDKFTVRRVDTKAGLATAVFADEDFSIIYEDTRKSTRGALRLNGDVGLVRAWAGASGCSTYLRVPSSDCFIRGTRPTIHAPGMAALTGDRRRWINVYDIQLL